MTIDVNLPISTLSDDRYISESVVRRLETSGYLTVADAALITTPVKIARKLGIPRDIMVHIIHTSQCRTSMVIKRRDPRFIPGSPLWFDIETDLKWRKVWLIGVVDAKTNKFYNFFADDWNGERDMLKAFGEFLSLRSNQPLMYYSCNGFDVRVVRNACDRLGIFGHPIFTQPEQDLCYELRRAYYLPTPNRKLKTMAKFLGYDMSLEGRDDYMDGKECAEHYIRHATLGTPIDPNVFVYNENDVWMLPFIINKLARIAVSPRRC